MDIPKSKRAPATLAAWLTMHKRTQFWLADEVGISIAQMSRIVRGINMPRAALALRIYELTGITVENMARARARHTPPPTAARIRRGQRLIARGQALIEAAAHQK